VTSGLPAVLVVSGGGFQGLAVLRLLAEADAFRVLVADSLETTITAAFADGTRRLPPVAEGEAFLSAVLELCRSEGVRLVLPATDHELEMLAAARPALLAAGTSVAVCDAPLLATLRDKLSLYASLAGSEFPVLESSSEPGSDPRLPLIGKPRHGFGGRGVVVVRTRDDLEAIEPRERAQKVWQPLLEGAVELSADFAVTRGAGSPAIGLRRRLRTSSGFAVVSQSEDDEAAVALVTRFARWAAERGGRGLFNVQLLRRGERLVVSDVNPRLGTSAVHWRGSGFNPVLELCAEAGLLPSAARARAPSDTRSVRYLEERIERVEPPAAQPLRGIVFDLDDTLIPIKRWMRERLLGALAAVLPESQRERAVREALRVIEEGPRDRLIDAVAAALGLPTQGHARLLEAYRVAWPAGCACYPDVKPALDSLRRRGLRLGLLTDNPPASQRQKLEVSGLVTFFDALVFAREAGAEKPDGRGFAAVAAALALPPSALAMAGDNPHRDLAGAAEAGFGRLFWVHRAGSACSFDPALADSLPGAARFERVADLRALASRLDAR
jgi:FMN phosphatase YigB (HAD superfamily)/carbamoylphosphate synthase large subunit